MLLIQLALTLLALPHAGANLFSGLPPPLSSSTLPDEKNGMMPSPVHTASSFENSHIHEAALHAFVDHSSPMDTKHDDGNNGLFAMMPRRKDGFSNLNLFQGGTTSHDPDSSRGHTSGIMHSLEVRQFTVSMIILP